MFQYKNNIENVIKRYLAFWNKERYDRIPIRIRFPVGNLQANESYFEPQQKKKVNTLDKWENIVLDKVKYFSYWEKILSIRADLNDDSFPTAPIDLGPALIGGIMGADITFASGTSWGHDPLKSWEDIDKYYYDYQNKWMRFVIEMIEYFKINSKGKFAVGLASIMGPSDILSFFRGPTNLCLDLYEYPDKIKEFGKICVKAYINTVECQFEHLPRYFNGTCENHGIWMPGCSNGWLSNDFSTLISPDLYKNILFELDQSIVNHFENCWMHVHASGIHMINEFINLRNLKGIQIVNDYPSGPSLKDLVPVIKMIQKSFPLILRKYSIEEIKSILPEISPDGLFIDTQVDSYEKAKDLLYKWHVYSKSL